MKMGQEHSSMIDLSRKPMKTEKTTIPATEEPSYPTLYIDKDLGFTEKDLNKKKTAKIEFRLKRVSENIINGKRENSCELEIMGIEP